MIVGLAAENRSQDRVVAFMPPEIKKFKDNSIEVIIETNAGFGSGASNEKYEAAGAMIVTRESLYRESDIVVRINETSREEFEMMRPGSISVSMLHYEGVPQMRINLEETGIVGLALDYIKNDFGKRAVYLWELTAENGMKEGYGLQKKNPENCIVKLLGYGNLARGAMTYAARKGSDVIVLNKRHMKEIEKHLPGTDILVNCINWPLEKRGKELIIKRRHVQVYMEPDSVIVDLVVNPKGHSPIETCRPTYLDNINYREQDVWHTCCWGWPNYTPIPASIQYSRLIAPHVIELVSKGPANVDRNISGAFVNIDALDKKRFKVS